MSDNSIYDVLVIGGGINGAGIARDAAGRGLSVLLCEQDDLAAYTSSASTKLIHGGLRYLEYYEFALVRKALQEREVLLRAAPHLIRPLSFVMPHNAGLRPAWMIRAGLFLYDHLARRQLLPASHAIDLREHAAGKPLKPGLTKGFVYSDAWVDDARLVVLNALDAQEHGATILPRTRCIRARRDAGLWELTLQSNDDGPARNVRGRSLFNAAGPWVSKVLHDAIGAPSSHGLRLAKGSHIVVPRLFDHDYAYLLQNPDRRIVFAIPYERDFTVIGTTDVEYTGNPADATISTDEINYLCKMASDYFAKPVKPEDVIWSYSGVRPLLADEASNLSAVTRDYFLEADASAPGAPLISVFGGKITTYRRLAEEALALLGQHLPHIKPSWTAGAPLPGGDIANADFATFLAAFRRAEPWLSDTLALRLARAYGTRVTNVLDGARSLHDLGEDFGGGLFEAEIEYLRKTEWAQTAEDILWRRTKLGLHVTALVAQKVASRLQQ